MVRVIFRYYISLLIYINVVKSDENFSVEIFDGHPSSTNVTGQIFCKDKVFVDSVLTDRNSDLIIFPEGLLTHWLNLMQIDILECATYLDVGDTPCIFVNKTKYSLLMMYASCELQDHPVNKTLVMNILEKSKCNNRHDDNDLTSTNCQRLGHKLYSTDVVMDGRGRIVARYRKSNLLVEKEIDTPDIIEPTTFSIDSGVKFGILNSFDLLSIDPTSELLKRVDKFVLLNFWRSELPFLTALQTQQMWSMAHNVQLFSSSSNDPERGSGGIGAYNGMLGPWYQGVLGNKYALYEPHFVNSSDQQATWERDEQIDDYAEVMDEYRLLREDLSNYTSQLLDVGQERSMVELCHDGLVWCKFDIKVHRNESIDVERSNDTANDVYTYRLVAYAGNRSFWDIYTGGVEVCGVIACLNSTLASCGMRFPHHTNVRWPLTFDRIVITANFANVNTKMQYPNSLLSSIRPIHPMRTSWSSRTFDGVVQRQWSLDHPQNRLLTFAIFGRSFSNDNNYSRICTLSFDNGSPYFVFILCSISVIVTMFIILKYKDK